MFVVWRVGGGGGYTVYSSVTWLFDFVERQMHEGNHEQLIRSSLSCLYINTTMVKELGPKLLSTKGAFV